MLSIDRIAAGDSATGASRLRTKAADVANQFEQLVVRELISGLQKTTTIDGEESGLFGSGPGSDTYSQWFDDNLSEQVAKHGRVGVAETLMQEFERWKQIPPAPAAELKRPPLHAITPGGFDVTA